MGFDDPLTETLAARERYRDWYYLDRDPILEDRLLWRAQTFRHMVHLLPDKQSLRSGADRGCSPGNSTALAGARTRSLP